MYSSRNRKVQSAFRNGDEYSAWCKEWKNMQRLFKRVEWVKKYSPGVRVVNK